VGRGVTVGNANWWRVTGDEGVAGVPCDDGVAGVPRGGVGGIPREGVVSVSMDQRLLVLEVIDEVRPPGP
jgi:hypothetical protein